MRPTLLNFRCPREKTPDFYNSRLTKDGSYQTIQDKASQHKKTNFNKSQRFTGDSKYQYLEGSGASSFLGPGTYNDHEAYKKLTKSPCSSVIKHATALPVQESGKPYYIMVGNLIKYEPALVENPIQVEDLRQLNTQECPTNLRAGISKRAISATRIRLKSRLSRTDADLSINEQEYNQRLEDFTQGKNNIKVKYDSKIIEQIIKEKQLENKNSRNLQSNNSIFNKTTFSQKVQKRRSNQIKQSNNSMNMGSISFQYDNVNSIFSTMYQSLPHQDQSHYKQHIRQQSLSKRQTKERSMLPKTANNFHKMNRGLYLKDNNGKDCFQRTTTIQQEDEQQLYHSQQVRAMRELPNKNGFQYQPSDQFHNNLIIGQPLYGMNNIVENKSKMIPLTSQIPSSYNNVYNVDKTQSYVQDESQVSHPKHIDDDTAEEIDEMDLLDLEYDQIAQRI